MSRELKKAGDKLAKSDGGESRPRLGMARIGHSHKIVATFQVGRLAYSLWCQITSEPAGPPSSPTTSTGSRSDDSFSTIQMPRYIPDDNVSLPFITAPR